MSIIVHAELFFYAFFRKAVVGVGVYIERLQRLGWDYFEASRICQMIMKESGLYGVASYVKEQEEAK